MQKDKLKNKKSVDSYFQELQNEELSFSRRSIDDGWNRISAELNSRKHKKSKRLYLWVSSVAAAVIVLFVSTFFLLNNPALNSELDTYAQISQSFEEDAESGNITLIIDGKKVTTPKEKSDITYSDAGSVSVDNQVVSTGSVSDKESKLLEDFNCVIVPKGKQINLTLSDGTKLYVNSRSKIIYPKVFAKNKREIYIEGESYLEVAHNKQVPFIVKTSNFDIQVLGTVFNVTSYKEFKSSVITLVEGSVQVTDHKKNQVKLKPSECVTINSGKLGDPVKTDVSLHTDWVHGYYLFNESPLNEILTKLSFYYDVEFSFKDNLKGLMLSGKLDIRSDFENVLENLSETAGVSFSQKNGVYQVETQK